MGIFGSKVGPLNIPLLVKQLNECQLPEDRNRVLDVIEQIDKNLLDEKTRNAQCVLLKESDGMKLLTKVGKRLAEDIEVISIVIQILESVKPFTPLVMDFIQYGGVDLLGKAVRLYSKDDYLAGVLPKLIKVVLAIGAASSIDEIVKEGMNLQLCQCCQEVVERSKHPLGRAAKIVIPHPVDRINRVLRFMDNFRPRVDVQIAALDAVIVFCRNADAVLYAKDTEVFLVVSESLKQHIGESAIVWRAAMAFSILASYTQEYAVNVCAAEVHEPLMDIYWTLNAHTIAQQQILWMCSALLKWPRSQRVLHKSRKCMDFFLVLTGQPTTAVTAAALAAAAAKSKNKGKEAGASATATATIAAGKAPGDAKKKSTAVDPKAKAKAPGKKDATGKGGGKNKKKVYAENETDEELRTQMSIGARVEGSTIPVAISIGIRAFLRETEGMLYADKQEALKLAAANAKREAKALKRRNFETKPMFGTLDTKIYTPGSPGLLREEDEDDDSEKKVAPPEWEAMLNYGEEKSPQTEPKQRPHG